MNLFRLDDRTAVNLDAIQFVRFSGNGDELSATVNFLAVPAETFEGEAARNLLELIGATPAQSAEPETNSETETPDDNPESYFENLGGSPFVMRHGRSKAWYHHRAADGRGYFLAFVNAKGSCSMRTFDAETGQFLAKNYPEGGGDYQDKFATLIENATQVRVNSQPNLERDCREQLPRSVLDYLKKQVKGSPDQRRDIR